MMLACQTLRRIHSNPHPLKQLRWAWSPVWNASWRADEVLHPWELGRFNGFRSAARRSSFVAGRLAAKQVLREATGILWRDLAILSWDRQGRSVRPTVWHRATMLRGELTLAHDDAQAVALWRDDSGPRLGVDVAGVRQRLKPATAWFDDAERSRIRHAANPERMAAEWFSMKEAAFKASRQPHFVPRQYRISTDTGPEITTDRFCGSSFRAVEGPDAVCRVHVLRMHFATACSLAIAIQDIQPTNDLLR